MVWWPNGKHRLQILPKLRKRYAFTQRSLVIPLLRSLSNSDSQTRICFFVFFSHGPYLRAGLPPNSRSSCAPLSGARSCISPTSHRWRYRNDDRLPRWHGRILPRFDDLDDRIWCVCVLVAAVEVLFLHPLDPSLEPCSWRFRVKRDG